jgi:uncharacterized protein YigA (DUF484 family)
MCRLVHRLLCPRHSRHAASVCQRERARARAKEREREREREREFIRNETL